jgi:hypothetical protein
VIAGQQPRDSDGPGFLAAARDLHAVVRGVLIVPRGEWRAGHLAVRAVLLGRLEGYVFDPWWIPDEERWLYLPIGELLADYLAQAQQPSAAVFHVVGEQWESRSATTRYSPGPSSRAGWNGAGCMCRGHGRLEELDLRDRRSGAVETVPAAALFVMIGAQPRTAWLGDAVRGDEQGYVVTGHDLLVDGTPPPEWPRTRPPRMLETSSPGVFAAGNVRHGAIKRVASAVGTGSMAVQLVHEYLGESVGSRST